MKTERRSLLSSTIKRGLLPFCLFASTIGCSTKNTDLKILKKAPEYSFINQNRDTITDAFYRGKVHIVEFFFTSCGNICPIMNEYMVKIQNEFLGRKDFGILSFTVDPEHDTPEVLKRYADRLKVSTPNWNFLTGNRDLVYSVIRKGYLSSVQKDPQDPSEFIHTDWFVLVDKKGNIRVPMREGQPYFYSGTSADDVFQIKRVIQRLLRE